LETVEWGRIGKIEKGKKDSRRGSKGRVKSSLKAV
jgi:hypothetical protein